MACGLFSLFCAVCCCFVTNKLACSVAEVNSAAWIFCQFVIKLWNFSVCLQFFDIVGLAAGVPNLNGPPRALAASTIAWVRS